MKTLLKRLAKKSLYSWRVGGIVNQVWNAQLTYLTHLALEELRQQCLRVEREKVPGSLIEAGCALGGSAIVMASAKAADRRMYLYDVFGLIPPPGEQDDEDCHQRYELIKSKNAQGPEGTTYYGYREKLMDEVKDNFAKMGFPTEPNHVTLVKGLFQDTLHPQGPIAVGHVDGDWYDSVITCLERMVPQLSVGGVLVIDDYHAWSGCRKAVDDFLQTPAAKGLKKVMRQRLHLYREQ